MTADGKHIGVAGTYKPQIKVFECEDLGMKFERTLDAEVAQFQFLGDDWRKILLLRNDRTLEVVGALVYISKQ